MQVNSQTPWILLGLDLNLNFWKRRQGDWFTVRKVPPAESWARCVELIRNWSTNEFTLSGKPIEASGGSESTPPPLYPQQNCWADTEKGTMQHSVYLRNLPFKIVPYLNVGKDYYVIYLDFDLIKLIIWIYSLIFSTFNTSGQRYELETSWPFRHVSAHVPRSFYGDIWVTQGSLTAVMWMPWIGRPCHRCRCGRR